MAIPELLVRRSVEIMMFARLWVLLATALARGVY